MDYNDQLKVSKTFIGRMLHTNDTTNRASCKVSAGEEFDLLLRRHGARCLGVSTSSRHCCVWLLSSTLWKSRMRLGAEQRVENYTLTPPDYDKDKDSIRQKLNTRKRRGRGFIVVVDRALVALTGKCGKDGYDVTAVSCVELPLHCQPCAFLKPACLQGSNACNLASSDLHSCHA